MKNIVNYSLLTLTTAFLFQGCKPDLDVDVAAAKGSADFSKYVAVGNSLTAGYADDGLYLSGQQASYPSLIAAQMSEVGGGTFTQPLFTSKPNGTGYLTLTGFSSTGLPVLETVSTDLAVRGVTTPDPVLNPSGVLLDKYTDPINNYGVPGIRLSDIADANYSRRNPLYERILMDGEVGVKPYLTKVAESQPTFFSCWLGNNDVLQYAGSGGLVPLTPVPAFQQLYGVLINTLTQNGAKGVVANLPSVTSVPLFNTVLATVSSTAKAQLKLALQANPKLPNFVVCQSGTPDRIGQTSRPADTLRIIQLPIDSLYGGGQGRSLLTLSVRNNPSLLGMLGQPTGAYWRSFAAQNGTTVQNIIAAFKLDTTQAFGFSPNNPFPTGLVLDGREQDVINSYTTQYNSIIKAAAESKDLAFVDANSFMKQVNAGLLVDGMDVSGAFISGGFFSLDGVHLTPRGYAIAANKFIQTINAKYNSKIPLVSVVKYAGVKFP
ncbi:SGNH/GDSL hydrolase family protein [Xanthocytophaga agilis]|uniref:SGNH/GDSL hydrolase family protein n=1 Tax=Xanthocytophaga agilis TaxID=3048010 RepID=A0AAE3R135_9BACT|nr:SGNH/GDSL hydrolase family protein [Xanthocytophaga agilis]MDJ1499692.1 SGNH/GDSL hydrolase family protein [Xanthocytophaga agilis]